MMLTNRLLVFNCGFLPILAFSFTSQSSSQIYRRGKVLPMVVDQTISDREALMENAKGVDEKIAEGESKGGYSQAGWSNRLGTVLTPAAVPGVYTADRPFIWNNIDVGGRMTVIQLAGGDLWVHSPVELDEALKDALEKLGTVKFVVSPNYEHLKYASQWHKEYPEAFMWGCPGLEERLPEIDFAGEIPAGIMGAGNIALENCWDFNTITPLHLDIEVNPFNGKPFFNEVLFYHTESKTLMTSDFYTNYPTSDGIPNSHLGGSGWELAPSVESIPFGSQLWKLGMDKIYLPFYKKFMVKNRPKYDDIVEIILDEWDIETVIPCHGDLIRGEKLIRRVLGEHCKII